MRLVRGKKKGSGVFFGTKRERNSLLNGTVALAHRALSVLRIPHTSTAAPWIWHPRSRINASLVSSSRCNIMTFAHWNASIPWRQASYRCASTSECGHGSASRPVVRPWAVSMHLRPTPDELRRQVARPLQSQPVDMCMGSAAELRADGAVVVAERRRHSEQAGRYFQAQR
jgi:hypothetical protein